MPSVSELWYECIVWYLQYTHTDYHSSRLNSGASKNIQYWRRLPFIQFALNPIGAHTKLFVSLKIMPQVWTRCKLITFKFNDIYGKQTRRTNNHQDYNENIVDMRIICPLDLFQISTYPYQQPLKGQTIFVKNTIFRIESDSVG
jgi:hypothetical protein